MECSGQPRCVVPVQMRPDAHTTAEAQEGTGGRNGKTEAVPKICEQLHSSGCSGNRESGAGNTRAGGPATAIAGALRTVPTQIV